MTSARRVGGRRGAEAIGPLAAGNDPEQQRRDRHDQEQDNQPDTSIVAALSIVSITPTTSMPITAATM